MFTPAGITWGGADSQNRQEPQRLRCCSARHGNGFIPSILYERIFMKWFFIIFGFQSIFGDPFILYPSDILPSDDLQRDGFCLT